MTVLEVIQRSSEFLSQKGVESPRLQTELLLAHVLKMPRLKLYLNFQRELATEELNQLRELVRRRASREPLQHIVGATSFCGIDILCTRSALVPRPETELLAERAWQFLEKLASPLALDIGTGTGCIAIATARQAADARIIAVDLSAEALELAKMNAARAGVDSRIEFRLGDAFSVVTEAGTIDLVVTNPPYIPSAEIATLDPEVRDYDPRLALDGGADGLEIYRRLAREGRRWLRPEGSMMMEFGDGQAPALRNLFENEKWIVEGVLDDYSARPRILIVRP